MICINYCNFSVLCSVSNNNIATERIALLQRSILNTHGQPRDMLSITLLVPTTSSNFRSYSFRYPVANPQLSPMICSQKLFF